MKDSCCSTKNGLSSWFCPSFVRIVAGAIMISAGAGKFLGGAKTMGWVGGSVLGIFGLDTSVGGLATLAIILGYIAASIELVGGLSFALGCRKTAKYAALGLAVVMAAALTFHLNNLKPVDATGFQWFTGVFGQVQLPLLLLAIFVQKSSGVFGCSKKSCCSTVEQSCCGSGKCEK